MHETNGQYTLGRAQSEAELEAAAAVEVRGQAFGGLPPLRPRCCMLWGAVENSHTHSAHTHPLTQSGGRRLLAKGGKTKAAEEAKEEEVKAALASGQKMYMIVGFEVRSRRGPLLLAAAAAAPAVLSLTSACRRVD